MPDLAAFSKNASFCACWPGSSPPNEEDEPPRSVLGVVFTFVTPQANRHTPSQDNQDETISIKTRDYIERNHKILWSILQNN